MAKRDLELNELNQSSGGINEDLLFQEKFKDVITSEGSSDEELLAMIQMAPGLDTLAFATQSNRIRDNAKLRKALSDQLKKFGARREL